ncbi:archaeal proteasome endopeptidase complex subunit alpha [Natronocalculus amylovorans]|uniref:Proteasome subunit alpha n=1 Tax=Natronocalculus amylovorans TaxID=2917812 RepID=A0AAE3FWW6_9EURY|nr:archaeal proteasome endopeptidase complex subunit alpha [Natronocalculus amylovorans]MCL9816169.1 archaeal proteasome endopeptidase complex subunit alpha [Natronocalculus amylovorans]NUE03268.1 archaeal proteasome endopeptidase complex subunit alpha [Halorubraceae archaeon YAN]
MRGNDQQAYDRGTSLFSPDGRIYQVEYAREAVSRGAPSVGIRTEDGVVLAAQSRAASSLMVPESIEKLHKLDTHVGTASAGHVADARQLIDFARRMSQMNRLRYGEPVGVETLTKYVTDHIQENTQRGGTRPYGAALLVAGIDNGGTPRLFGADPSGTPNEWKATVIGGGSADIQALLEEEWHDELTVEEGVELAVKALRAANDELLPGEISVATVTDDDGYVDLTAEEIEAAFDSLGIETDPDEDDEAEDEEAEGEEE